LIAEISNQCKHGVCVDISQKALARAQKRIGRSDFTYICADIYQTKFSPGTFDLILGVEALDYTSSYIEQITKWKEWLTQDGIILATAANLPGYIRYDKFRKIFLECGLTIIREEPVNTKFFLRYLINRDLIPWKDRAYIFSMWITRKLPRTLTKHLALLLSK
jgi:SAM-dependent methyltransferase